MNRFLFLLFAMSLAVRSSAHTCMHGDHELQNSIKQTLARSPRPVMSRTYTVQTAMESIRINFSIENLLDDTKFCTMSGQSRPLFTTQSGSVNCVADDIMTTEKADIIWMHVIPAAVELIQGYLKVNRLTTSLQIPSNVCGSNYKVTTDEQNGVANTDFYILISAGPVGNQNTLAYAGPCLSDGTGRPVVGKINFNPYFIKWDTLNPSINNDNLIQTAHHEIAHALGFTSSFFTSGRTTTVAHRGKTNLEAINTPTVLQVAKEYFGCDTIDGVEIEDEGASGSKGAHWDRRIIFEELMTASAGTKMSVFTLAFFKDLGFYDVDFSKAEPITFGKQKGCGFISEKCNTPEAGLGTLWCNALPSSTPAKSCTFDRKGIGQCNVKSYTSDLETYFRYYSDPTLGGGDFVDKCPYIAAYSNFECAYQYDYAGDSEAEQAHKDLGYFFGAGGRCLDTGGLRRSMTTTSDTLRCMKARCPFNGSRVEVMVGETWICCPLDGSAQDDLVPPPEWTGSIKCPPASAICDHEISFGSSNPESKPIGNTELPSNEGTAKISAEVIFNGTGWSNVLASDRQRVDLFNSIRIDFAQFLRISSRSLMIRRVALVEEGLSVLVGIIDDDEQAIAFEVFTKALETNKLLGAPIPLTREAYGRVNSDDSTVMVGYSVEEKRSSSICSSSISPDHCIMIIGICVTVATAVIVGILMYFLCFKSPFDIPPQPKGLSLA